jgi:antitoxin component YwqK of YwqJK toxin-antitoxin module
MLAYKAATSGGKRVIITLEIPPDALTNINRKSVAVRETAKHRTNKAKVLKIEGEDGTSYTTAQTAFFTGRALIYKMGEVVEELSYDPDPDHVCSSGIHFFLSKRVAELYGLEKIENGLYQQWYENGVLSSEGMYTNGLREGIWRDWHSSGAKEYEGMMTNGKAEGVHMSWYENGTICEQASHLNGKREGISTIWSKDGSWYSHDFYADGVLKWGQSYTIDGTPFYHHKGDDPKKAPSTLFARPGC